MKRSKILINILIIITSLFLIYKVYSYIDLKRQEKESVDIYKEIEKKVSKKDNKDEDHANGEADLAKEEAKKVDFDALEAINKDIVCWLESDEGSIDYPVVKGRDNYYYLYRAANGKRNLVGSIFMDYRNESIDDPMVMIYGHMIKNGTMFASLHKFKDNPSETGFTIYTREQDFRTTCTLAARISGETYINPKDYKTFKQRKKFYNFLKKHAVYDTNYELKEDDKIINFVTCTYEANNQRLIVLSIVDK